MDHKELFDLLPWNVMFVDADLYVRSASEATSAQTGLGRDSLIGRQLLDVLNVLIDDYDPRGDVRTAIAGGARRERVIDVRHRLADGPARFHMAIVPVGSEGAMVCLTPLPETAATECLEQIETLSEALRSIKHEINNPLTGALGNVNMLLRRNDFDEKTRKRLTTAEQEMKKIGEIVVRLAELVPGAHKGAGEPN